MKKKVQPILALPLAALLLVSSGCGGGTGTSAVPSVPDKGASSSRLVSSKADASSGSAGTRHIKKQLDKNLTMDADVILPGKSAYSSYPLVYRTFTSEELTGLFFSGDTGKKTISTDYGRVNIQSSSEAWAVANTGTILFQKSKREQAIDSILNELGNGNLDGIISKKLRQNGLVKSYRKDLSFISRSEAVKKGADFLRSLHLSCDPAPDANAVAMTGTEIKGLQDELLKNPNYKDFPKTVVVKGWSDKDDSYWIRYTFQKDGLPVYGPESEPSVLKAGSVNDTDIPVGRMSAEMILTSQGLRFLRIYNVLTIKGNPSASKPVLSVDKAVECLKNKYADVILTSPHKVKKIYLKYIVIPDSHRPSNNRKFTLQPYWCFLITTAGNNGIEHQHAARFNAFTGKDLEYEE